MRVIKFLAWDGNDFYSPIFDGACVYRDWRDFENSIETDDPIIQYSGIKDKNGREIFEGSVICETYDGDSDIGLVYFAEGMFKVNFKNCEDYALSGCDIEYTEVIGNVFRDKDKYKEFYEFFIL